MVRGRARARAGSGRREARHYRYTQVPRASGPPRVIETPKPRLKALQRRSCTSCWTGSRSIAAAHGFVGGRSARTHAAAHVGRRVVVRLDLEDFFAGVTAARVFGFSARAGYPRRVAHVLTGLCTNAVPRRRVRPGPLAALAPAGRAAPAAGRADLARARQPRRVRARPAACPASPPRSARLYTRYADDLVLSSDAYLRAPVTAIAEIARDEGFRVNAAKTRVMGRGRRQTVTGVVVNARPNVPRAEYER